MPTKELQVTQTNYMALSSTDTMIAIRENIGEGGMTALDLPRIRIPAGGGTQWLIPSAEGDKSAPSFSGIIAYWTTMRAYWETDFAESGGGVPPSCSSQDGSTGVGLPGGDCLTCPLNAFGSDSKQRGKACREVRANFVLLEDSFIPMVFMAPVMSIRPEKDYMMRLASSGLSYSQVETKFALEQDKSSTGIKYSKAIPTMSRRLTPDETASVSKWKAILKGAAATYAISEDDMLSGE